MATEVPILKTERPVSTLALIAITGFSLFFAEIGITFPNVALPLMLKSLHLSKAMGGFGVTLFFIGCTLMFFISGTLMDRWSRIYTFALVVFGSGVFFALMFFAYNPVMWLTVRFLSGTSFALIGIVPVLLAESVPAHQRGFYIGVANGLFGAGAVVASLISSHFLPLGEWRVLFLLPLIPLVVIGFLALRYLRDSTRFALVAKVKHNELRTVNDPDITKLVDVSKARKLEWKQVFAKDLRRQSWLLSIFAFFVGFGMNFLLAFSVIYLTLYDHMSIGVAALAIAAESFATMLGQFASGWLADYFSARKILAIFGILGGVSIYLLVVRGGLNWVLLPMIAGGFFGQGLLGCLPRYAADSYPTRARGSGTTLVTGSHFFGPVFTATFYGFLLQTKHLTWMPIIAATITVCASLIILFGKEIPPKKELEDIAI